VSDAKFFDIHLTTQLIGGLKGRCRNSVPATPPGWPNRRLWTDWKASALWSAIAHQHPAEVKAQYVIRLLAYATVDRTFREEAAVQHQLLGSSASKGQTCVARAAIAARHRGTVLCLRQLPAEAV